MPVGVGAKPAAKPGAASAAPVGKPTPPPAAPPAGAEKKGGKAKLIIIIALVVVILAVLAVAAVFVLKTLGMMGAESSEPAPEPSTQVMGSLSVSTGEPININLEEGYLSFAATIYFDDGVDASEGHGGGGDIDHSPARDAAYRLFKGMSVEELQKPSALTELQQKYMDTLNKETIPPYNGHVAAVRFTTFAFQ